MIQNDEKRKQNQTQPPHEQTRIFKSPDGYELQPPLTVICKGKGRKKIKLRFGYDTQQTHTLAPGYDTHTQKCP